MLDGATWVKEVWIAEFWIGTCTLSGGATALIASISADSVRGFRPSPASACLPETDHKCQCLRDQKVAFSYPFHHTTSRPPTLLQKRFAEARAVNARNR